MNKRLLCLLLALTLLLAGCVGEKEPTEASGEGRGAPMTAPGTFDNSPGTILPPEGDYQIPPQPTKPVEKE